MELKPLTIKQARVLRYIIEQVETGNGLPTIREIGTHFGMSSTGSVRDILNALLRKGYTTHAVGKARGMRLNSKVFKIQVTGKNSIKIKSEKKK